MPSVYTMSREQFEQRMRVRRAATCLAVARSAIASGKMAEAIDRLEEACSLDPDASEARLLLEELRPQEPAGTTPPERRAHTELAGWSHWVAAAIAICALATLAFFWPVGPSATDGWVEPSRESPSTPADDPLPSATGTAPAPAVASHVEIPSPGGATGPIGTAGNASPAGSPNAAPPGSVAIKVTDEPVVQRPLPMVPANGEPAAAPGSDTAGAARAALEPNPGAVPAGTAPPVSRPAPLQAENASMASSSTAAMGGDAPAVTVPPARPAPPQLPPLERVPIVDDTPAKVVAENEPAPVAKAVAPARNDAAEASRLVTGESGEIEGTLRRYADAYSRLDAAAARAVWPTVDQRALARAFDGLQSQGVVFEHCDVTVSGDDATAACSGRAQFVPKVGSREPLVERRQWTFRLRKAVDAGWQITQAEAR
jgi:hypothetical protein